MDETETGTDPHTGLAEIDEPACWKLLGSRSVGRLAVIIITPERVTGRRLPGRKASADRS